MKDTIAAVIVAILSYLIAVHLGIWCGTATFLMLLIVYKKISC